MHKSIELIFLISLLLISTGCSNEQLVGKATESLQGNELQENIEMIEWYNPEKYPRIPFEETDDYERFKSKVHGKFYPAINLENQNDLGRGSMRARVPVDYYIVTNPELYNDASEILNKYLEEVSAYEKYNPQIMICDDCSHENLKDMLNEGYENGLKGAFLIGDLPYAWMEMNNYEFPTVYYYMDLDGFWPDTNENGIYEEPEGEIEPEIFISILRTDKMTLTGETEKDLLENYFNKVTAYKKDKLNFGDESLLFVDNVFDLSYGEEEFVDTFNFVSIHNELETTSASDYLNDLSKSYYAIYVMAHSDPWIHGFSEYDEEGQGCEWYKQPGNVCYNGISNEDLLEIKPHSLFYFLKGCAVGRFTEQDNMAGWYILQPDGGLITFAPSESIATYSNIKPYFEAMQEGKNMGQSFFELPTTLSLKYMMVLFGDPTIRLKEEYKNHEELLDNYYYANQPNEFQLVSSYRLRGIAPLSVNIYLNEEKIDSFNQKIRGKDVKTIKFIPNLGFNSLKVCSIWGEDDSQEKCTERDLIAAGTININQDNLIFDCEEQGINPLIGEGIAYPDTSAGILIESRNNITIQNCNISLYDDLIRIANSTNITIKNSQFFMPSTTGHAFIFLSEQGYDMDGEPSYLGSNSNIYIQDNTFGSGDAISIYGDFSESIIEDNYFGGTSMGVVHFMYLNQDIIFRNNYACPKTEEMMKQVFCEANPLIVEESIGNNFDTYNMCANETWPIYNEHFLYCDENWRK